MKTKYTYIDICIIALPVLFGLLAELLIGVTASACLGRIGLAALVASSIGGMCYTAIFMMAFGFSIGIQVMIARRNGEKRYQEIGNIFYQGVYFLLALAVIVFLLSTYLSPYLIKSLLSSPEYYDATSSYIYWRTYGFFFSFIGVMFRAFFMGTTKTLILLFSSILLVLSNILFCIILGFGNLGFPKLGITGIAIGSTLAELISVIFLIVYTWKGVDCQKYGLRRLPRFQPKLLKGILNTSGWTMIQSLVSFSLLILFFHFIEQLDEKSVAVTNIIRHLTSIPFTITTVFALTCGALVSNLIGAGDKEYVPGTIRQHIRIAYVCILPVLLFLVLLPDLIIRSYTDTPELRIASIPALWVLCSAYLLLVPANIYFQAVSGTGNTRTALMLELCALAAFVAYIAYVVLYLRANIAVCFTTEYVYGIVILILSYLYIKKGNWQNKKI